MSKEDEEQHQYNCDCANCQEKHGNLPLLVEVMESTLRNASQSPQPSTSQQSTSSAASKSKKAPKIFNCTHCDKSFTHRGDFNKHLRKHTGCKPFQCNICGKTFAHTSNLHRHLRIHSGKKPFQCQNCGKKFGRKDKFNLHRKSKYCQKNNP